MFLKNVFTQCLTAFFEDDARNKKQNPKFFLGGGGEGGWECGHGILQLTSSVCKQLYLSCI